MQCILSTLLSFGLKSMNLADSVRADGLNGFGPSNRLEMSGTESFFESSLFVCEGVCFL